VTTGGVTRAGGTTTGVAAAGTVFFLTADLRGVDGDLDFGGATFLVAPVFFVDVAVFAAMFGLLSTAAQAGRRKARAAVERSNDGAAPGHGPGLARVEESWG
jgi:hypothetical protein